MWKSLVAAEAAAHMPAVQQNAATWLAQAYYTCILDGYILRGLGACRHNAHPLRSSLQSLELPPQPVLLPAHPELAVVASTHPKEDCGPCQSKDRGQHLPHNRLVLLLHPQGLKVCCAQEVLRTVSRGAQLEGTVCVQNQFTYTCKSCTHLEKDGGGWWLAKKTKQKQKKNMKKNL